MAFPNSYDGSFTSRTPGILVRAIGHGFGLDDDEGTPPALPGTPQENPDHAIAVLGRRMLAATAQQLKLVTKGDVLEDQQPAAAKRSPDQMQDELKHPDRLAAGRL